MSASHITQPKEEKVNVALGERGSDLDQQARAAGTTKTNLARVLICDGLDRLKSGEFIYKAPSIEPINKEEVAA